MKEFTARTNEDGNVSIAFDDKFVQALVDPTQSHRLNFPYLKHMAASAMFLPEQPKAILELGFGCGVLCQFLTYHYPDTHLTTVEQNAALVKWSVERHWNAEFTLPSIVIEDAVKHVKQHTGKVDWLLCDLYDKQDSNPRSQSIDFYQNVKNQLNPNGIAAFNVLLDSPDEFIPVLSKLHTVFNKQVLSVESKGGTNIVFIVKNGDFDRLFNYKSAAVMLDALQTIGAQKLLLVLQDSHKHLC